MPEEDPVTYFDGRFSQPGSGPMLWSDARVALDQAEIFWLSTVRGDGRPHVTPLLGVWSAGALYFCTGSGERKAKNLGQNSHCILTTGHNVLSGFDLVVEGQAEEVEDRTERRNIAAAYESKYGPHFAAPDGTWSGLGDAIREGQALLYRVAPSTAFGFCKGEQYSETRWDFS